MSESLILDRKTLRKLQLKELESLTYFDEFCRKNGLTYFMLGGCVIGAVRHNGFIPWDDDIDLIMPRKHYEKMLSLWKEQEDEKRFVMLYPDGKTITHNPFATLVDTTVTLVKDNQKDLDIPRGVVTDIFPLDGCPDGKIKRYLQYYHAMVYSLFSTEVIPSNHGGLITFVCKALLAMFRKKETRVKIYQKAERKMSQYDFDTHLYCTELCAGPHYMQNKYPQNAFAKPVYHEFEGLSVPLPQGWDEYLTMAFGDYMALPPEEKQIPHHDLYQLDLDTPYQK